MLHAYVVDATAQAVGPALLSPQAVEPSHLDQIRRVLGLSIGIMAARLEQYVSGDVPGGRSGLRKMMADAIHVYSAVSPVALKHLELMGSGPQRIEVIRLTPATSPVAPVAAVRVVTIALRDEAPPS